MPSSKPSSSTEATRRRLLDAGLEAFGERGFDAVSTRDLAEKAGTNQAAIPYHFGGKEGLYMAVVEDLVETVQATVGTATKNIQAQLAEGPLTLPQGEALISALVGKMVEFLVGAGEAQLRAAFVIRELMHPSAAFDLLYEGYMKQVHTTITKLVASLLGDDPESITSILRAHALLGEVVIFGAGRELIRRRAGWDDFTEDHLEQITEAVTETFLSSIRSIRAERGMPSA